MSLPKFLADRAPLAGLLAVFALGLYLRLWGVETGAPYRMGADEPIVLSTSVRMMKTGDFNPHFFDYGGLTFAFHAAVSTVSFLDRAMSGRWHSLDQTWFGDFLVPTRTATAIVGALTIFLVYFIGLRWGPRVAIVSALVFAILPAHVRESHFTLTDTPLTFFTALTLLLSIRAAEQKRLRALAFAGAAIGLTAAVKYNGAIVAVMPALATLAFPVSLRVRALGIAAAASIVTFLIAAPYTVLDLPAFLNGFAALMQSYNRVQATATSASWTYIAHLRNWFGWPGVVPLGFGYVGLLLTTLGLFIAYWRRLPATPGIATVLPLAFGLVYFWFISNQSSLVYGRYLLPLAPVLALGAGIGLTTLSSALERYTTRVRPAVLPLLFVLIAGPLAATAVSWNLSFARPVTLDQAARWVAGRQSLEDVVVIEGTNFVVPPRVTMRTVHRLVDKTYETYRAEGVRYLVASTEVTDTHLNDPTAMAAYRALIEHSDIVQTYTPTARRSGPTITVLKLKD